MKELCTVNLDLSSENADWTKQSWDLPPYRSPEFMEQFPDLSWFRGTQTYILAVKNGLIHDDEWVGDYATDHVPVARAKTQEPVR